LERLADAAASGALGEDAPKLYQLLADPNGLPGRAWYRNILWAPGHETGYAAVFLPTLASGGASQVVELIDAITAAGMATAK
jgi:hypothetical protein